MCEPVSYSGFCPLTFTVYVVIHKELHDLQESVKETSVVLQIDNSRDLNMDQIIFDVKAQYEFVATRSREEVEKWQQKKVKVSHEHLEAAVNVINQVEKQALTKNERAQKSKLRNLLKYQNNICSDFQFSNYCCLTL